MFALIPEADSSASSRRTQDIKWVGVIAKRRERLRDPQDLRVEGGT